MYESLVLFSEFILSAYPILIKKVQTSIFVQTGFRMFVFAALAFTIAILTGNPVVGNTTDILATGALNLAHVGSSYSAFAALPAGNAMALFYTYPLWNLLASSVVYEEKIETRSYLWMSIALLGAVLVAQPGKTAWNFFGIAMAIVAALTETGIYLWFKRNPEAKQPWTDMTTMYGGSSLLWLLLIPLFLVLGTSFGASATDISIMVAFNIFVGFLGYALRFFTISNISTVAFSSLSFVGVIASYLLGWFFMGEIPTLIQGLGAGLIALANILLLTKK